MARPIGRARWAQGGSRRALSDRLTEPDIKQDSLTAAPHEIARLKREAAKLKAEQDILGQAAGLLAMEAT
ncbi:MAG: hypothetical protein WBA29_04665 [Xanthobacteraceae bacterium]